MQGNSNIKICIQFTYLSDCSLLEAVLVVFEMWIYFDKYSFLKCDRVYFGETGRAYLRLSASLHDAVSKHIMFFILEL